MIALRDVLGQIAGLPVHGLLAGGIHGPIPVYANHSTLTGRGIPSRVESEIQAKEMGF